MKTTAAARRDDRSAASRPPELHRQVVSFARRDGRYRRRLARAWDADHAALLVVPERSERSLSVAPGWRFAPVEVFGRVAPLVVEIGTGTGEAILAAAGAEPARDFLGVEVYRPGLARTLVRAQDRGLANLRLLEADAREVVRTGLAPATVDEFRVFFPDPWPKPRHHKRRLVDAPTAAAIAAALCPGGLLRLATDWDDYADQMVAAVEACALFARVDEGRFPGRPITRFEAKAAEAGRTVRDLTYRRVPSRGTSGPPRRPD